MVPHGILRSGEGAGGEVSPLGTGRFYKPTPLGAFMRAAASTLARRTSARRHAAANCLFLIIWLETGIYQHFNVPLPRRGTRDEPCLLLCRPASPAAPAPRRPRAPGSAPGGDSPARGPCQRPLPTAPFPRPAGSPARCRHPGASRPRTEGSGTAAFRKTFSFCRG